jgi:hypothetical protein
MLLVILSLCLPQQQQRVTFVSASESTVGQPINAPARQLASGLRRVRVRLRRRRHSFEFEPASTVPAVSRPHGKCPARSPHGNR